MKRTANIEWILAVLLIGIAIGIIYCQWQRMENSVAYLRAEVANQDQRLVTLEKDRAEQLQSQARASAIWKTASRWLKIGWGIIKSV